MHLLDQHKIEVIFNLTSHTAENSFPDRFDYRNYCLVDKPTELILSDVQRIADRVQECLDAGQVVLVHCQMGISRAPSAVIAYLIRHRRMSFEAAFELLKQQSPRADPNVGFLIQLQSLGTESALPIY